jgi:hypothetical protein
MASMGQHEAAGTPLRRAHRAAWAVFLGMAGTTMTFQVYHAVTRGQMPWELAVLYGVVPLAISIGVLDFASKWHSALAQAGAYTVTAGAMFLSASATGAVTGHAAPSHGQLLFGGLMDAAALLAVRFIMSGPTAAQAVAAVVAREAELLRQRDAERSAREQAEAAGRAALTDLKARADAELAKRDAAWREEMTALRAALGTAEEDLAAARSEAEKSVARVTVLERKLEASGRKRRAGNGGTGSGSRAGSGSRKPEAVPGPDAAKPVPGGVPEAPADLDAESAVLWYVDQGLSASAAGIAAGLSDSRGRQIVRKLTAPAPAGVDPVTGAASGGNVAATGGGSE